MPDNRSKSITQIKGGLNDLLDKGYTKESRSVIAAILGEYKPGGALDKRIRELEAEVKRLNQLGLNLSPNNPYIEGVLTEFEYSLKKMAKEVIKAQDSLILSGAKPGLQAARQLTLPGLSDDEARRLYGVVWNRVDPEAVSEVVKITTSNAWMAEIERFSGDITSQARLTALRGIMMGQNPRQTARDLTNAIEGLPRYRAESLMRTLQLAAYRKANTISYMQNADILDPFCIRIATLDSRVCISCVALHGTEVSINEVLADHRNGRCTTIAQVKGVPKRQIQTGVDWFNNLPEEGKQRVLKNPANYNAYKAGEVSLQDFVHKGTDPVFGGTIQQKSLKEMIGENARKYYYR